MTDSIMRARRPQWRSRVHAALIFYGMSAAVMSNIGFYQVKFGFKRTMPGPIIVSAESVVDNISSDKRSLSSTPDSPIHYQLEKTQQRRTQLRAVGEKGRDLQNGFTQQSLAQAIANGLRAQHPSKTTTQKQLPSTAKVHVEIVAMKSNRKTRGNNQAKKNRGRNSHKRRNIVKKRSVNNRQNVNKKQQHGAKNRGSSRNNKRNSRANRNNNKKMKKKRGSNAMKTLRGNRNYTQGSKHERIKQVRSSMVPQYSGASSFLNGINTALNQHQGHTNGANTNLNSYGSGKPVNHKVYSVSSGWDGSSHEDPIIWEGGLHTDSGWSGVLQPCACSAPTWGGSVGKSGKSSLEGVWGGSSSKSGKWNGDHCLCLISGAPPSISTTFLPTYMPTYYPTSYPTYFPTDAAPREDSVVPTSIPTAIDILPTLSPSFGPTLEPTIETPFPTASPTFQPTLTPSITPTADPTVSPSVNPTVSPSLVPTVNPTITPSFGPTLIPTPSPTLTPSLLPTVGPVSLHSGSDMKMIVLMGTSISRQSFLLTHPCHFLNRLFLRLFLRFPLLSISSLRLRLP
eukprot:CCRYP_018856-RD/>CCRYP_018856-RD protein AED:0.08 eAED:0.08 QI:229/1/1/1/0.92/0.85/14/1750/566